MTYMIVLKQNKMFVGHKIKSNISFLRKVNEKFSDA